MIKAPLILPSVKLIDEIRRENLDRLQKEAGSLKALAELLQRDESQVSQWRLGSVNSGTGKPRGMRADTARYIEERTGKPPGWLDQDHSPQSGLLIRLGDGRESPARAWEHPDRLPDVYTVFIPRISVGQDARGQATITFVTTEPQAFDTAIINADQLKPIKLGYIETTDDSMHPTIERGDKCVVDTSQLQIVDGRTYAIFYDGTCRLRRLFRLPNGGLRIEADNQRHAPMIVGPEDVDHITVLGRVVLRTGRGGL